MNTILEISNWNQLVKARSENYPNLRIVVTQYNSEELVGTKISVVDYNTNDIYFSAFATDMSSTIIPETGTMWNDDIMKVLNDFEFNVKFSEPIAVSQNVMTILEGLYAGGYRYIYKHYIACIGYISPEKYGYDFEKYIKNEMDIYASVNINNDGKNIPISRIPEFHMDEWEWVKAFTSYPIKDIIDTGTVPNGQPI